jgi:DNA modification methylase
MSTKHTLVFGDSRKMSFLPDSSVDLIVTSPPYWQLKDYGDSRQIGFNDTYEEYINNLNLVWKECLRVLREGCRLCVNVGDQFARSAYYGRYKVIPIHSEVIRFCESVGFDYMGDIIWQKPTNMHPSGGQRVMGSFPYPRNGIIKIDFEHILLFRKQGKSPSVSDSMRSVSQLSAEEWDEYFSSHWTFKGARQDRHIAVFPEELPKRLIRMFSFMGETVLDPFMGSGTTAIAAAHCGRNSVGYEINKGFYIFYREKVINQLHNGESFQLLEDSSKIDRDKLLESLPYRFVDTIKINKSKGAVIKDYGSKVEMDQGVKREISHFDAVELTRQPTVLVNHARQSTRRLMMEKGICYLRAGDVKGSLLIQSGFENLQYVLLHTNGEDAKLFKLCQKGKYQIWKRETLVKLGFSPSHAQYYIVLHFYTQPIPIKKMPNLKEDKNTFRVKIKPIGDFL